jgi:hypothetical protein
MPARGSDWNSRVLYIKSNTGDLKIRNTLGTYPTTIDGSTDDINIGTNYRAYTFLFDADFERNGKIWILSSYS